MLLGGSSGRIRLTYWARKLAWLYGSWWWYNENPWFGGPLWTFRKFPTTTGGLEPSPNPPPFPVPFPLPVVGLFPLFPVKLPALPVLVAWSILIWSTIRVKPSRWVLTGIWPPLLGWLGGIDPMTPGSTRLRLSLSSSALWTAALRLLNRRQINSRKGGNLSDPKSSAVSLSSKPKLEYGMFDVVLLDAVTPALTQCLLDRWCATDNLKVKIEMIKNCKKPVCS